MIDMNVRDNELQKLHGQLGSFDIQLVLGTLGQQDYRAVFGL